MSVNDTTRIAEELLARMGAGADPNDIAALFSTDLQFEIAGDAGALPWIGKRDGRSAQLTLSVISAVWSNHFASTSMTFWPMTLAQ